MDTFGLSLGRDPIGPGWKNALCFIFVCKVIHQVAVGQLKSGPCANANAGHG